MPGKNKRVIRSPRGRELSAKYWATEAPLRLLMNNLDPTVEELSDQHNVALEAILSVILRERQARGR